MLRQHASLFSVVTVVGLVAIAACAAPPPPLEFGTGDTPDGGGSDNTGTFKPQNGNADGGGPGTTGTCVPTKGNAEIPDNKCDDDGDGTVDNAVTCDSALTNDGTPEDFARSIGLCQTVAKDGWGLVSAKFTRGYGRDDAPQAQQHNILGKFGNVLKPREGSQLGVLSTGYALEYDGTSGQKPFGGDSNGKDWFDSYHNPGNGTAPPGFPKAASGCSVSNEVNDVIDLRLEIKAPPNASGMQFDFNFHSGEWPAFICSEFNDGFIAYLNAKGFNSGAPDNISFDAMHNPVSVNNGFFDRCTPGAQTGCDPRATPGTSTCPGGAAELAGTGFGIMGDYCGGGGMPTVAGGATGWLASKAPITAGETFTVDFMIWDTGDGDLDSSVLLDNFQWVGGAVTTSTERPQGPN